VTKKRGEASVKKGHARLLNRIGSFLGSQWRILNRKADII
jgi:hypothetical protein